MSILKSKIVRLEEGNLYMTKIIEAKSEKLRCKSLRAPRVFLSIYVVDALIILCFRLAWILLLRIVGRASVLPSLNGFRLISILSGLTLIVVRTLFGYRVMLTILGRLWRVVEMF
jgi:hypothetical protein